MPKKKERELQSVMQTTLWGDQKEKKRWQGKGVFIEYILCTTFFFLNNILNTRILEHSIFK